ncbi:MAG: RidA family protein [Anaerolineae bacterium]|nr:RidA family protein [Anaerolineae bacterium]
MPKMEIRSNQAPQPGGAYSQALRVGDFVYVSGVGPKHPASGEIPETIEEQTALVLESIRNILAVADARMDDVVKSTVHLSDLSLFQRFNSEYAKWFPEPRPVRTTVGSQLPGIMVEIDVVAWTGE